MIYTVRIADCIKLTLINTNSCFCSVVEVKGYLISIRKSVVGLFHGCSGFLSPSRVL